MEDQILSVQAAQMAVAALKKAGGGDKGYVDEQVGNLRHDIERDYLKTSDANKTYLKDGSTTNELMINRTAGGSIDSMKVTAITGGATVWRLDCKAGKDGPVIYKTEGSGLHRFVGKVDVERLGQERQGFCLKGRKTNGEEGDLLYVYHNSGTVADAVNYTGKMDSANNIVNKKYVDDAVGISTGSAEVVPAPAQLTWKFDSNSDTHTPPSGKFSYTSSGGDHYLRFSFMTANGCDLGDGKYPDTNQSMDYGPIGTIWYFNQSSGKWKLKRQFRINTFRWNYKPSGESKSHFEMRLSHSNGHSWSDLTEGVEYAITVGGLF